MTSFADRYVDNLRYLGIRKLGQDEKLETRLLVDQSLLRAHSNAVGISPSDFPEQMSVPVKTGVQKITGHMLTSTLPIQPCRDMVFPLLGRRIISGETTWDRRMTQVHGEFNYIAKYWEWTEDIISRCGGSLRSCSVYDAVYASLYSYMREPSISRAFFEAWCPLTNTLHTRTGEFSISLWDLYRLGGLPVVGTLYDEAIPSFDELQHVDAEGIRGIPRACHYLLIAYHHLKQHSDGDRVTSQKWIEFWCKSSPRYAIPKKRRRESKNPPKVLGDPSGKIDPTPLVWTDEESKTFELLGIKDDSRKQSTYVAAFLSCWLCNFVLPESEDRLIRPSTFEVSSLMSRGTTFSLAVPVLASIYRGLRKISISKKPSFSGSFFPAHYLYSWIADYFNTHHEVRPSPTGPRMVIYSGSQQARFFKDDEARMLIHEGKTINLSCTASFFDKEACFHDNGTLEKLNLTYLICLRTLYLPSRTGEVFSLEPYCPYRFAKQFGFCQGVPGLLDQNVKTRRLPSEEAIRRWKMILFEGSNSRVSLSSPPRNKWRDFNVIGFEKWWNKVTVDDLLTNASVLNSVADAEPCKKAPRSLGKKKMGCSSLENILNEGSGESPSTHMASKSSKPSQPCLGTHEAEESDGESDTNFKHNRGGKKVKITTSTEDFDQLDQDLFASILDTSDAPSVLALDGAFNLDEEVPSLINDSCLRTTSIKPTPGRGKEISKLQYLAIEANEKPCPISEKHAEPSPSRSQRSVDGPNSLELATKLVHGNQNVFTSTVGHTHNMQFPALTEATIVPETEVKDILLECLERSTRRLLNSFKNADFTEVEKIAREAVLIYKCMKTFKGNPTLLREKIDSYVTSVRTFHYLEEVASARCNVEGRDKDLALKNEELEKAKYSFNVSDRQYVALSMNEELEKAKYSFNVSDRQYVALSMNISTIDKEIAELEGKLARARDSRSKLASDANSVDISRNTSQGLVSVIEAEIAELEVTPKLSAEDLCLALELRSSFNPGAWMDLVL